MKMPKPTALAVARFEALVATVPGATVRPMFGQPAAFLNGAMFLGVFGSDVVLRLDVADRAEARKIPGVGVFEPMPGRAMTEYVTLPPTLTADLAAACRWVERSARYAATVKQGTKPKAPGRARPTR